jgi:hypothetical protein
MKSILLAVIFSSPLAYAEKAEFIFDSAEDQIDGSVLLLNPSFLWKDEQVFIYPSQEGAQGACRLYGRKGRVRLAVWSNIGECVTISAKGTIIQLSTRGGAIHQLYCY